MNAAKMERIRAKVRKLLLVAEKKGGEAEKAMEPIADKLAMNLYLSDHTGRWMVCAVAAVYVAGDHFGVPTLAQAFTFLKASLL